VRVLGNRVVEQLIYGIRAIEIGWDLDWDDREVPLRIEVRKLDHEEYRNRGLAALVSRKGWLWLWKNLYRKSASDIVGECITEQTCDRIVDRHVFEEVRLRGINYESSQGARMVIRRTHAGWESSSTARMKSLHRRVGAVGIA